MKLTLQEAQLVLAMVRIERASGYLLFTEEERDVLENMFDNLVEETWGKNG